MGEQGGGVGLGGREQRVSLCGVTPDVLGLGQTSAARLVMSLRKHISASASASATMCCALKAGAASCSTSL